MAYVVNPSNQNYWTRDEYQDRILTRLFEMGAFDSWDLNLDIQVTNIEKYMVSREILTHIKVYDDSLSTMKLCTVRGSINGYTMKYVHKDLVGRIGVEYSRYITGRPNPDPQSVVVVFRHSKSRGCLLEPHTSQIGIMLQRHFDLAMVLEMLQVIGAFGTRIKSVRYEGVYIPDAQTFHDAEDGRVYDLEII